MTHNKKVIPFPKALWTFWDVAYDSGSDPMEDWYEGLSDEVKLMFVALLKNIQKTEKPQDWVGFKRFLQGKYREERIWELEFVAEKRQYRVLGKFGAERKQAVLFLGCYHKGKVYTPPDALDSAYKMAKALSQGGMKLRERKIPADL